MNQPPRVLIIDDEPDIREVARMGLELVCGWHVSTATGGMDGVAQATAGPPDAILLDVMMPDVDGPETFRLLQTASETKAIPIVFLTARTQPRDVDWLEGLGAEGVIPKPFDPMTLGDQLSSLLGWSVS